MFKPQNALEIVSVPIWGLFNLTTLIAVYDSENDVM